MPMSFPPSAAVAAPVTAATTADSFRNSGMRGQHTDSLTPNNPRDAAYVSLFSRSRSNASRRFVTLSASAMGGAYAIPAGLLTTIATDLASFAAIGCQTILQISLTGGGVGTHEQSNEFWAVGSTGPAARAAHVAACRALALQYAGDERIAAIGFMNEPWHPTLGTSSTFTDQMLAHQEACIDAVREVDPNRVCMVTCAWFGAPGGYTQMRPVRQKNVVYEVHFYAPYEITHANVAGQAAYTDEYPSLTQRPIDVGVGYGITNGGAIANRPRMESIDLLPVIRFAQQYDVPIYVGEFTCGMMNKAGTAVRWIEDAISVFEQYGFSWCQFGFWFASNPWVCFEPGNSGVLIDFNNGVTSGQAALSSFTGGSTDARTPFSVVAHALRDNKLFRASALLPSPQMLYSESFEGALGPLATGLNAESGMTASAAATATPASGTKHALFSHISGAGPSFAVNLLSDTGLGRTFDEYAFQASVRLGQLIASGKSICIVEASTNGGGSGAYWRVRNVAGTNTWQFEMWRGSGDYGTRPFLNITGMALKVGAYTKIRVSVKQDPSLGRIRVWQDDKLLIDVNNIATVTTNADYIWRVQYGLMLSDQRGQSVAFDDVSWAGGETLDWVAATDSAVPASTTLTQEQTIALAAGLADGHLPSGVNNIGVPGSWYFGLGVCPAVPAGWTSLPLYGNYRTPDGSDMVWIPAFYYRIGHASNPTFARWALNSIHVLPFSAFANVAAANAAGYALPRAFYNAGAVQLGFFVDKYQCSNNGGIASSIRLGNPLSSNAAHNPFSGLTGAPANNYGGAFAAAKTRGSRFFPLMRYQRVALAMLCNAQAQAASSAADCAWWDGSATGLAGPKGCNNNALGDANDAAVSYVGDGYQNCGKTGSGVPFAKTTHNGQESGIADLNGNVWEVSPGVTCVITSGAITSITQANPAVVTQAGHGRATGSACRIDGGQMTQANNRHFAITVIDANTYSLGVDSTSWTAYTSGATAVHGTFQALALSADAALLTGGNTLATDAWGATGLAAHSQVVPVNFGASLGFDLRYGNAANQVISAAVSGDAWLAASLGFVATGAALSGSGIAAFGQDYFYAFLQSELCPAAGGSWNYGSTAGVWAVYWSSARSFSSDVVGFRSASYL